MISRRSFFTRIAQGAGMSLLFPSLYGCTNPSPVTGKIMGPNANLGHRLRTLDLNPSTFETVRADVVVVGGGVAGLSAARYLKKFTNDFLLVELEDKPGGNAMGGNNGVSAFPWGAHYLPLPGNGDDELTRFLSEAGVITGTQNGLPFFNEYYLCHDPKERLFINHFWQEGILPHEGVPAKDREELDRFMDRMHDYKVLKGSDGRDAFAIPVSQSSQDKQLLALDAISAEDFLTTHHFTSPFLRWYVNYCCADDYGTALRDTSAWAMIHYFASRKGKAANASSDAVLTWPEGNFWLVNQLKKGLEKNTVSNTLAYQLMVQPDVVEIFCFDALQNTGKKIIARSVILATPQFVNQRILPNDLRSLDYQKFQYAPWMVANITTDATLDERRGEQLCWDNVLYGSDALGYVNAIHQQTARHQPNKVITYYKPLLGTNPAESRTWAQKQSFEQWKNMIVSDLKMAHPKLEKKIQEMNVWIWGHGMVKPQPGFIWGRNRIHANVPIKNKIFFAHSDLSGISIFEEAFYNGHTSAKAALGYA